MDIIQKLKIKPKQEKLIAFEVNIRKGVVKNIHPSTTKPGTDTKEPYKKKGFIIDRTDEGFDRNDFLNKLKRKRKVLSIDKVVTTDVVKKKPKRKIDPTSPTVTIFRFIKKLDKKVILNYKTKQPRKPGPRIGKRQRDLPIPESMVSISEFEDRLWEKSRPIKLKYSNFYLNNREIFVNFINGYYSNLKKEISANKDLTCEDISKSKKKGVFSLLTHQKVVRDYINIKTPYRGLLLYHGLGAGKTCSSVAIAEGLKNKKQIIIMAPASLIPNYKGELKFCGDPIYKLNQHWDFISTDGQPDKELQLSQILSIDRRSIRKAKGAWLVDKRKKSNFTTLTSDEKVSLNLQINKMIDYKYRFIAYNGYRLSHLDSDSNSFTINPFDNKVIIIDEAHNLVSRIVNKIKKKDSVSYKLYDYLMSAQNCKIVLLTGTPIVNYPNEIGILFNIIRGYIKTFKITLTIKTRTTVNEAKIKRILSSIGLVDYVKYSPETKILEIVRNPFGFVNSKGEYKGVTLDESGNISDIDFIGKVRKFLSHPKGEESPFISFNDSNVVIENYKALPDQFDEFNALFKNSNNTVKNPEMFKKRIVGLTSYFRSAQEALMPNFDYYKNLHVIKVPMSDHQITVYQEARDVERKQAKDNAKKQKKAGNNPDAVYGPSNSTYRVFSRSFCNFVFPNYIARPYPNGGVKIKNAIKDYNEEDFDGLNAQERVAVLDANYEVDELDKLSERINENKHT